MADKQFIIVLKDKDPLVPNLYLSRYNKDHVHYSTFGTKAAWRSDLPDAVIFINADDALFACEKIVGKEPTHQSFLLSVAGMKEFIDSAVISHGESTLKIPAEYLETIYLTVIMIHNGNQACWETLPNRFELEKDTDGQKGHVIR